MSVSKVMQQRLDANRQLRDKVAASITLPELDWSGLCARQIGSIVDTLRALAELAGNASNDYPLVTRFEDSPGVTWATQNGLIIEAIETWANEQCGEAQVALEHLKPASEDDRDERIIQLMQFYARQADFDRAVALLTGAPTVGTALAKQVVAYVSPAGETPDMLSARGLDADAGLLAMAKAVLAA